MGHRASTFVAMQFRFLRLAVLALIFVFVVAACDIEVEVLIDVEEDGAGLVTVTVLLDEEAVAQVPEIEEQLRLDDLREAGWMIDGPFDTSGGGLQYVTTKRFGEPGQLQLVLNDLTGPDAMLQDFRITREPDFAETSLALRGIVDMSRGVDMFTDAALAQSLGGTPFGINLGQLEAEFGPLEDNVRVTVIARIPGVGDDGTGGAEQTVRVVPGDGPETISLATTDEDEIAKILPLVGKAALGLGLLALLVNVVTWSVDRSRRKNLPAIRTAEPMQVPASGFAARPGPTAAARRGGQTRLGLVVVDIGGVLYEQFLPSVDLFARVNGCTLSQQAVAEAFTTTASGRATTAELWSMLGLEADPAALDATFISTMPPHGGARDFIEELRRRGMQVAALGNCPAAWSQAMRDRDRLDGIAPWIDSSDAGVTSPAPGLFEAMRRATGVPFEDWLFIHADLESLDTGKTLGMSTVWMTRDQPPADQRPDHAIVHSFADFFRRK